LVTVVNREYCKKLLAQLPGQHHPEHWHEKKEETFHVLWGSMDIVLNQEPHHLEVGDMILIRPGDRHSFSTETGAIVEELGTAARRNDSFYSDPLVARLDPIVRKTVIDGW
jgi:mannose-6-phosphate isomerase-like protein (cupin superfamily)